MCSREELDLESLAGLSARLGRDPMLTQASSGNTSAKVDGVLWIKASGTRLADADERNIFVAVDLSAPVTASTAHLTNSPLRPSIETAMHVQLPQKIVVHVHSVNTIAWAVRRDGQEQVASRLAGLHWSWIPYVPSGLPLAQEVAKALQRNPQADVFILANHGLVVCGESCEAVESLLRTVEARLTIAPRQTARLDCRFLDRFTRSGRWTLPSCTALHGLGTDAISRSILRGGVLIPCQAIFLAPSLTIQQSVQDIDSSFLIVENLGVLLNCEITIAEYEMLLGLAGVVQRLESADSIRYLAQAEVTDVLAGNAYR